MSREVYTLADLRDWPGATASIRPPLRLAVFGDPVAHSASPPMHNAALAAEGIDARYTRVHVRADELAEALRCAVRQGFIGVNLTIPHKTAALRLLDTVDDQAALLGAVNTVHVETDGRLSGSNTDGPGFVRAVRAEFGIGLEGRRVLIFGAGGGAGRALAAQCVIEGCATVLLVNRTPSKAYALADEFHTRFAASGCEWRVVPWDQAATGKTLAAVHLVVNASAVGLHPGDSSLLATGAIPARLRVFDTVYRRDGQPTPLVAAARAAGADATGGLSLLLHQGALSFERWFHRPAPLETMRAALQPPKPPTG